MAVSRWWDEVVSGEEKLFALQTLEKNLKNGVEPQTYYKVKRRQKIHTTCNSTTHIIERTCIRHKVLKSKFHINSRFEKLYCLNFGYTDNEVNMEYVA